MSIEKSPASANPHKAVTHAASHGAKPQAASNGDAAPNASGGGFMAILGALGDAQTDAAPAQTTPADGPAPDATLAPAVPAAWDASTLLQQNPQIGAAQVQGAAADATLTSQAVDPAQLAGLAGLSGAALGMAPQAVPPGQPASPATAVAAGARGVKSADGKLVKTVAAGDALQVARGAADSGGGNSTQSLSLTALHAKQTRDAAQAASTEPAAQGSTGGAAEQAQAQKLQTVLEPLKTVDAAAGAATPLLAPLVPKAEKSLSERKELSVKGNEPTYGGSSLGVSAPDFSQTLTQLAPVSPESQVADQVHYWVSQNIQNAELKLDGLGDAPVQVSISLQGNEAQIAFRSDEVGTREVLERAGAQLKDMLHSEGLVLTGVSVGTSGSGGSSADERRARQASRQLAIGPLQVGSAETAPRARAVSGQTAGRSVDLFV